jgi:hypothetical protein
MIPFGHSSSLRCVSEQDLAAQTNLALFLQLQTRAPRFFFQQQWEEQKRERRRPRERGGFVRGATQRRAQFGLHRVIQQPPQKTVLQLLELVIFGCAEWPGKLGSKLKARFRRESRRHWLCSIFHFSFFARYRISGLIYKQKTHD